MPSSHLILCRPLLLLPPIHPSIRVFSNESTLRMRWPKYWSGVPSPSPSVFPILLFSSISFHWSLKKAFLPLLDILWNFAFRCLYLSFSPLLFASLLYTAICKASSDSHFAFFAFLFHGDGLDPFSCKIKICPVSPKFSLVRAPHFCLFWTTLNELNPQFTT